MKENNEKKIRDICDKLNNDASYGIYHNPYSENEFLQNLLDNSEVEYNSELWLELEDLIFDSISEFWDM